MKNIKNIQVFFFLGNPGQQYEKNRHNYGFMLCDELQERLGLNFGNKFNAMYSVYNNKGEKFYFIKPMTYMNKSGESLSLLLNFFKIEIEKVLVIHDDLELNFGEFHLKTGGGLAGHNGLRSIAKQNKSKEFLRLRMGIGKPSRQPVDKYVLSNFSKEEEKELPFLLACLADLIIDITDKNNKESLKEFLQKKCLL